MTENVIELRQYRTATHDSIKVSAFDLEQALTEYLMQNGQITNADEVVGLEVLSAKMTIEPEPESFTFPEIQIIVKREG